VPWDIIYVVRSVSWVGCYSCPADGKVGDAAVGRSATQNDVASRALARGPSG